MSQACTHRRDTDARAAPHWSAWTRRCETYCCRIYMVSVPRVLRVAAKRAHALASLTWVRALGTRRRGRAPRVRACRHYTSANKERRHRAALGYQSTRRSSPRQSRPEVGRRLAHVHRRRGSHRVDRQMRRRAAPRRAACRRVLSGRATIDRLPPPSRRLPNRTPRGSSRARRSWQPCTAHAAHARSRHERSVE